MKQYQAWGQHPTKEEVVDCGAFSSPEMAYAAIAALGLECAELEYVYL